MTATEPRSLGLCGLVPFRPVVSGTVPAEGSGVQVGSGQGGSLQGSQLHSCTLSQIKVELFPLT